MEKEKSGARFQTGHDDFKLCIEQLGKSES